MVEASLRHMKLCLNHRHTQGRRGKEEKERDGEMKKRSISVFLKLESMTILLGLKAPQCILVGVCSRGGFFTSWLASKEKKRKTPQSPSRKHSQQQPQIPTGHYLVKFLPPHNSATFCVVNKLLTYVFWRTVRLTCPREM